MAWLAPFLPPDLSGAVIALLLGTSFIGSLITVAFGIGGGALRLAVMAVTMPPLALIPVHGAVQLGSNAGRAVLFVHETFWPALQWFVIGSVIGVAVGGNIAMNIPPGWCRSASASSSPGRCCRARRAGCGNFRC